MDDNEKRQRHREAVKKHAANNVYQFKCAFNRNKDKDIIEHLESKPNKQGYIKKLIRDDMKEGGVDRDNAGSVDAL